MMQRTPKDYLSAHIDQWNSVGAPEAEHSLLIEEIREVMRSDEHPAGRGHDYQAMAIIYEPPFLPINEIRLKRFAETRVKGKDGRLVIKKFPGVEMNDRFWEW